MRQKASLRMRRLGGLLLAGLWAWGPGNACLADEGAAAAAESVVAGQDDATGTDPRAFGSKFMPYWRYTELENGLESWQLTAFGMIRITDDVAMTYEIPLAKETDVSDTDFWKAFRAGTGSGQLPPNNDGSLNQAGSKLSGFGTDGSTFGMGDANFRFFAKNERLRFKSPFRGGSGEIMGGFETLLPTATKDVLGGDTWVLSPMLVAVLDMPLPFSFLALMNFYDFDIHKKGGGGGDVSRYRGRWFYMQPLSPPGPKWYNGIYLLPELQPVYDFRADEFSLWLGPELGKIVSDGRIVYLKPGFGLDTESNERDWTFEIGFRYFF